MPFGNSTLTLQTLFFNGPLPFEVELFVYSGDGLFALSDFSEGSLVTSVSFNGDSTIVFDVKNVVNSNNFSAGDYVGFNLRFTPAWTQSANSPFAVFRSAEVSPAPQLSIETVESLDEKPIPEPASLLLFGVGLLGLRLCKQKHKK